MQTYNLSEEGFGYQLWTLEKFSEPRMLLNDSAKEVEKWRKLDLLAVQTVSCRLVCAVRNLPCAVTYCAISRAPNWSLQLAVDSNI